MEIERAERPVELKEELLRLAFRVYKSTGGAYPALEWAENKPSPGDFEGFREVYEPFLKFRLRKEFDELYLLRAESGRIAGTVALVYNLQGKDVWWVPKEIMGGRVGLVELFMVDPEFRGMGYGSRLLAFAVDRLREIGKIPYVITFPNLDAYSYYLKKGFREVMRFREFVVLRG
ncbi:GNAT family N-acetyltransferase [Thermococcus sp.]